MHRADSALSAAAHLSGSTLYGMTLLHQRNTYIKDVIAMIPRPARLVKREKRSFYLKGAMRASISKYPKFTDDLHGSVEGMGPVEGIIKRKSAVCRGRIQFGNPTCLRGLSSGKSALFA